VLMSVSTKCRRLADSSVGSQGRDARLCAVPISRLSNRAERRKERRGMNVTIDIGQPYSVEVLEKYAGTEHEREAVGMVLRRASDHLYQHITPDAPCDDFAAVDLLDDLRAELGVL